MTGDVRHIYSNQPLSFLLDEYCEVLELLACAEETQLEELNFCQEDLMREFDKRGINPEDYL